MLSLNAPRPFACNDRGDTVERERRPPTRTKVDKAVLQAVAMVRPSWRRASPGLWREARRIVAADPGLDHRSDADIAAEARSQVSALLRHGFGGQPLICLGAAIRQMTHRRLGLRQHPVQIVGGLGLLKGQVIEMATGEGKTLTTLLPAIAAALTGTPVHVITVNDYLVQRDHETLKPVFDAFGLTSAHVTEEMDLTDRPAAYLSDIVFTTAKTVTFDYLRDRTTLGRHRHALQALAARTLSGHWRQNPPTVARGLGFAILDEVDSILIDEAQTPLILTEEGGAGTAEAIETFLPLARQLAEGQDYKLDRAHRRIDLEPVLDGPLTRIPLADPGLQPLRARREWLSRALTALHLYERGTHYVVAPDEDGEEAVQIVDENTGRLMPDRRWQKGLHQMIEAKEGLTPSADRETIAQITYQTFFSRYLWFSGMSGTVREVGGELRASFGRPVTWLPTHTKPQRRQPVTQAWPTGTERWQAIAQEVRSLTASGRPVMIGTRSVRASEEAAEALRSAGLSVTVLNATQDADEAGIVARAGQPQCITVATNMAGRGTDIPVSETVEARGGLHVILTEFHPSARIDRQLYGRTARQGQQGSVRAMVALDDALFTEWVPGAATSLSKMGLSPEWLGRGAEVLRRLAQAQAEAKGRRNRRRTVDRAERLAKSLAFQQDGI